MLFSHGSGAVIRVVADLGNSRLKWGLVGPEGGLLESLALPTDDPAAWSSACERWGLSGVAAATWAVSTVNPPEAERLRVFLAERGLSETRWYRSAADGPVRHVLEQPELTGADRALAVAAAIATQPPGRPGLVVSCGSAITVERIAADGVWQGGAIAPGLGLSARALHLLTAQLPLVTPRAAPPAWGNATRPALEAGLFWGVVGTIRELLTRQSADLAPTPWLVWTGGDAPRLAPEIAWPDATVVPDLVLDGLARVAFGSR